MGIRLVPVVLLALLVALHAQLWLGRGSLPQVAAMQQEIEAQKQPTRKCARPMNGWPRKSTI